MPTPWNAPTAACALDARARAEASRRCASTSASRADSAFASSAAAFFVRRELGVRVREVRAGAHADAARPGSVPHLAIAPLRLRGDSALLLVPPFARRAQRLRVARRHAASASATRDKAASFSRSNFAAFDRSAASHSSRALVASSSLAWTLRTYAALVSTSASSVATVLRFSETTRRLRSFASAHVSASTSSPSAAFSAASFASRSAVTVCCPWKHARAMTAAPRSRSSAACVSRASASVFSSSPIPYRRLTSFVRETLRSTQNGSPETLPSTRTRAVRLESFTTSVFVRRFDPPWSTLASDSPVRAHIARAP